MIEPRRAITGDEADVYGRLRKYMNWRPGETAAVKRRTNRRERRERQTDIDRQLRELNQ